MDRIVYIRRDFSKLSRLSDQTAGVCASVVYIIPLKPSRYVMFVYKVYSESALLCLVWLLEQGSFPSRSLSILSVSFIGATLGRRRLVIGFSPRRLEVSSRSVHVRFVVDKVAVGQCPVRVLRFLLS
jgi:hypothetical protein